MTSHTPRNYTYLMTMDYFIHDLGFSQEVLPKDVYGHDLPGHGASNWDLSLYDMETITSNLCSLIPQQTHVVGHGFGAHLALNIALKREDISVTAVGMLPAQDECTFLKNINTHSDAVTFNTGTRTYQDLVNYSRHQSDDIAIQSIFIDSFMKQDPLFIPTLLDKGLTSYNWDEINKVKSLGPQRFQLVLNKNDPLIESPEKYIQDELSGHLVHHSFRGHTPWAPKNYYQYLKSSDAPITRGIPL